MMLPNRQKPFINSPAVSCIVVNLTIAVPFALDVNNQLVFLLVQRTVTSIFSVEKYPNKIRISSSENTCLLSHLSNEMNLPSPERSV